MLIIRKSTLIVLLLLCLVTVAVTAAAAYMIMTSGAPSGTLTADELRFRAEKILFAGILEAIAFGFIFVMFAVRSKNISRELDKLIKQNRLNPASTADGMLRLGETGRKLNTLFHQLEEISRKRGLKISALSAVAEFLSQKVAEKVTVIDVTGRVIHVSGGVLKHSNKSRNEIIDRYLDIFTESVQLREVISGLEKNRMPIETEIEGKKYKWIPILNNRNEISYIAVIQ